MIISALLEKILKRQPAQQDFLPPFSRHVDEHIVHYEDGRLGFTVKLEGIPFEGVNDSHLVAAFTSLKTLFAAVGKQYGGQLGLWTTLLRRKIDLKRDYRFRNRFCQQFADKYIEQFNQADYYENLFYISGCLKYDDFDDGLDEAKELLDMLVKGLKGYDPHILGTYTNEHGIVFSEIYQFYGMLINGGMKEDHPLTASAAYTVVPSGDLYLGTDIMEIRTERHKKNAVCYDLKDFGVSKIMVLQGILSLPCEFVLTQSFVYTDNAEMQSGINKKVNELEGAKDYATDQHEELRLGKGELAAGRMMFGDYSAALVVYGETPKDARNNGQEAASTFLTTGGYRFLPATQSMASTFYSQIPGYKHRPRIIPKTTTNLATVFGMHTYSQGKSWGNPIGDGSPVMPLKTLSNTLFNLSLHYSRLDQDSLGEQIAGHTLIMGATGTGKTTLETAVLSFMMRFDPYLFVLDLDKGLEIFVRAVGGSYFTVEEGVPSGLNPFQLPDNPSNRMFLYSLVKMCAGGASAKEQKMIQTAVDTVYELPFAQRRFSRLLESITYDSDDRHNGNDLRTRLEKWCESEGGQYAWALDNPENKFNPDDFNRIGLDLTAILKKDYEPTGPVLAYLFYLKDIMARRVSEEGGILASVIAEFWYAASFDVTADLMMKALKTGRKMGEFMIMDTQSPEDAIACPIFPAIVQQTPTKLMLPNPDAKVESYRLVGITDKEFSDLVKKAKNSREFLVKQSNQSVFCKLDLYGFNDEMVVLSGTGENVEAMYRVMEDAGSEDPDVWLPLLYKNIRARTEGKRRKGA